MWVLARLILLLASWSSCPVDVLPYRCDDASIFLGSQARLDVHRFGITGYKKEQQRVFEQDRAIMLGARVRRTAFLKSCNRFNYHPTLIRNEQFTS